MTSLNRTDANGDLNSDTRRMTSPTRGSCSPHRDADDFRPLEQTSNAIAREERENDDQFTLFLLNHAVEIGVHESNVTSDARGLL